MAECAVDAGHEVGYAIDAGHGVGYAIDAGHGVGYASESPPEEEQPLLKKLKFEEDDNQQPLEDVEGEEDDSDDWPESKATEEDWALYDKQVEESEGFDIDKLPDNQLCGLIVPITNFDSHAGWLKDVNYCSSLAMEWYNTENDTKFKFLEVLKLNAQRVAGFMMYITFVAENVDGGHCIFQALVYQGIGEHEVEFCRLKPEKGGN